MSWELAAIGAVVGLVNGVETVTHSNSRHGSRAFTWGVLLLLIGIPFYDGYVYASGGELEQSPILNVVYGELSFVGGALAGTVVPPVGVGLAYFIKSLLRGRK